MNKKADSGVWLGTERINRLCEAQTWKTRFHVSIFMWLMLSATSLVVSTCSWESVGFGVFTLGFSSCCVPLCRNADRDGWSARVSAAGCFSVLLCPRQELLYCSWYSCKGHFSTNFYMFRVENVFQQEEVIIVKEASGSSALALCPGPCGGWRSSAMAVVRVPRHSLWTGPGCSQLLSSSPTDIEGVLNPSTEVHGLEGKEECCSK